MNNIDSFQSDHTEDNQSSRNEEVVDKTCLIVNYLPQSLKEKQLCDIFKAIGQVKSCRLMYDKSTGYSFGYGFVQYLREDDASRAIAELNGLRIENKRLKVSYSRPQSNETRGSGLCIRNLPENFNESSINDLLKPYGSVVQARILRDQNTGYSRGMAFVIMSKRSEALNAIKALQNKVLNGTMTNSKNVVTTNIGNENGTKEIGGGISLELINNNTRKRQNCMNYFEGNQQKIMNLRSLDPILLPDLIKCFAIFQHNTAKTNHMYDESQIELTNSFQFAQTNNTMKRNYENVTVGCGRKQEDDSLCLKCCSRHQKENGFNSHCIHSHQDKRLCVKVSYKSKPQQNDIGDNQCQQDDSEDIGKSEHSESIRCLDNAKDYKPTLAVTTGNLKANNAINCSIFCDPISNVIKNLYKSLDPHSGGFIIYVFGIGPDPDETQLKKLFQRYGHVVRVDIIRNLTTGKSKGYAFVTMISYDQAVAAITALNGIEFGGRKLQVRFKA